MTPPAWPGSLERAQYPRQQGGNGFLWPTLGWTFEPMPMEEGSTYWIIKSGDKRVGGIFEMVHPTFDGIPELWFTHFAVDDIKKRVAAVRENGGTLTREPFVVSGVGTLAVLQSASGSYCAFIQPAPDDEECAV